MRKIEVYLPEAACQEVLSRLEALDTVVALAVTPCEEPEGQRYLSFVLPDVSYNEALGALDSARVFELGVMTSSRVQSIKGARVERLKDAIGTSESEAVAWEETLQTLEREGRPSPILLLFVALASLIALCGLVVGSIPILLGAMVIPPALSSLILIPIAVRLRQPRVLMRGMFSVALILLVSVLVAWGVAFLLFRFSVVPHAESFFSAEIIQERTQVGLYAYAVAVAAGIAGGVSVATDRPNQLVGVMIAAAIIPSAATVGLGLSQGDWETTWGSARLLVSNVVLIMIGAWLAFSGLRTYQRWSGFWFGGPGERVKGASISEMDSERSV